MHKKMKKRGASPTTFMGKEPVPLLYFLRSLFGIKTQTKIFFGCTRVKLFNKLREPFKCD